MMSHEEALGFAHILLIILVFALEIPVLVVEASADDRIRHLLHKRVPHRLITTLMILTITVVVWLIVSAGIDDNPVSHKQLVNGSQTLVAKAPPLIPAKALLGPKVVPIPDVAVSKLGKSNTVHAQKAPEPPGNAFWRIGIVEFSASAAARILSTSMLILFGACWYVMMKSDIRTWLVTDLGKRIRKAIKERRVVVDADLEDLILLGENGSPGHEKAIVIKTLGSICDDVRSLPSYTGNELGVLVRGLERILDGNEESPTTDNFIEGIGIVQSTWTEIDALSKRGAPDITALIETTCSIAELALRSGSDAVASASLDVVPDVIRIPFRVGLAALLRDNFRVALAALSRLEAIAERKGEISNELIALVAHFAIKGRSGSHLARSFAGRIKTLDAVVLERASAAVAAFYLAGDFLTADLVSNYLDDLRQTRSKGRRREAPVAASKSQSSSSVPVALCGLAVFVGAIVIARRR